MADNPHLADFLEKLRGPGADKRTSDLLPPIIAPGLFNAITGASEAGNYNSLKRIAERIQQARANADQDYMIKLQRQREKKIMNMIKKLQRQINTPPPPSFSGGGGGGFIGGGGSIGGGGGLVSAPPRIAPSKKKGTGLNPGSGVRLPVIAPGKVSDIFPILK